MSLQGDLDRLIDQQRGVNNVLDATLRRLVGDYPVEAMADAPHRPAEPCVELSVRLLAEQVTAGSMLATRLAEYTGAHDDSPALRSSVPVGRFERDTASAER